MAGIKGVFTAFVLDSDIPALLSKGALEPPQGRLDFARHALALGTDGTVIPLQMGEVGRYFLSAEDFPQLTYSASWFHWAPKPRGARLRVLMRHGGLRWAEEPLAPARSVPDVFTPPQLFSACKAAALRDAGNAAESDPKIIIMKLHINWGHASAARIKRVLVDAEGDTQSPIQHVDDAVSLRDTCKAFEKAPHGPISGTS